MLCCIAVLVVCLMLFPAWSDVTICRFQGYTISAHVQVSGFPTIKFVTSGDNKIQEYNGERDVEAFISFLKKNAKIPFEVCFCTQSKGKRNDKGEALGNFVSNTWT